jgi:hypothetical protein
LTALVEDKDLNPAVIKGLSKPLAEGTILYE